VGWWATWLPFGTLSAPAAARAAALAVPALDALSDPATAATVLAGGAETPGALPLGTGPLDGAIFTSRGRGYANYNEDAAVLLADGRGRLYAAAFDQAGGLGGEVRGAASRIAAERAAAAFRRLALAGDAEDPQYELLRAFMDAHRALLGRRQGEVTTAVVAVVDGATAHLLNSGDSGAIHYGADGAIRARTVMHEMPPPYESCLRHALGLEPEGCEPEPYRWALAPGDWVVLASDGLLDSGLAEEALPSILARASSAEAAVNTIATRTIRRMGYLRAKPDNLSVVAVRRRPV
jgi:serine/threonine protein phosphatase PrpC